MALALGACGPGDDGPSEEDVLARDRAAEFFLLEQWSDARRELAPLVEGSGAPEEDLVRAAQVELAEGDTRAALALVERAEEEEPALLWCRYRIARLEGQNEEALEHARALHRLVPDDVPAHLVLAMMLHELALEGDAALAEEAERSYRELLDVPPAFSASWRLTALYRAWSLLTLLDRAEEAQPWIDEYNELTNVQGLTPPGEPTHQAGTLGSLRPHRPGPFAAPAVSAPASSLDVLALSDAGPYRGLLAVRLGRGATSRDLGQERGLKHQEFWDWRPSPAAVLSWGAGGLELVESTRSGDRGAQRLREGTVLDVAPIDLKNAGANPSDAAERQEGNPDLDLFVLAAVESGTRLFLLENVAGEWSERETLLETDTTPEPGSLVPLDYDHDGDVDLLVALPDGLVLLRNDGANVPGGAFTDATAEAGLPAGSFRAIPEDVDWDSDVDLLLVAPDGSRVGLASNARGGRFTDESASLPAMPGPGRVVAADLDGDGLVDLAHVAEVLTLFTRDALGGWRAPRTLTVPAPASGAPVVCDWDLDGLPDLLWPAKGHPAVGIAAPGFGEGVPFVLGEAFEAERQGPASIAALDFDGDGDHDLVRADEIENSLHFAPGEGRGLALGLEGHKDNARAVGAIVEVREGLRYQRLFWRGEPVLLGFGEGSGPDVLRVTWPNGVEQNVLGLEAPGGVLLWQRRGLVGSCPFLYSWNGETYEFISDVIGITPLGLPMAPGMVVPPDHDEYVLVRGEQLVPRDGVYELQLTEELREVTYLDRVRLDVIDHPAGVEIQPNERFSFPPFPEAHVHTVRDPLLPTRATGSDGADWTDELTAIDGSYAQPFTPHRGQFQGLATPHFLELAFDPAQTRDAEKLRLLFTGWLYWTDASVNMASARHPEIGFVPPILQVPDGAGGWRDVEPPLGFPAGKRKTMVIDVSEHLDPEDPRLRVFSTLRLYWDAIRLAVDDDDAPLVITELEPAGARLWERGFSDPILLEGELELEWFAWERLAAEPRWNMHPGLYTRLGDVLPLVTTIDDRFCVLGAGDALTLRFDARAAPELPAGWERDFLFFIDGWAKDRDPNTLAALYVEPLPFHGMSSYPYGADESFPDTPEHRAWRREWQTRPARRWIESLVPPRPLALAAAHQEDAGE